MTERDLSRYAKGKIYAIRSLQTTKYYIGSTCLELHKRLYSHKQNYKGFVNNKDKYMSSFEIIKYDDCYIELIEYFPCKTKAELRRREGELQREKKNEIVNRNIAGRICKEWCADNNDLRKVSNDKYYQNHKEEIKERTKIYYENNKEKRKQQMKLYYEANKK